MSPSAPGGCRTLKSMATLLVLAQGNGHERDKLHFEDRDLYILDIYGQVRQPLSS